MIKVTDEQHTIILDILKRFVPHCEVRAFGSRYKGAPKDYSDLDLAVVGDKKLDWHVIANLKYAFEESDLPYRVDVLDWYSISSEFRRVIEKGYEVVYQSTGEVSASIFT
jgi:predicted nucleotidyltransferase